jgi:hypothetical protein
MYVVCKVLANSLFYFFFVCQGVSTLLAYITLLLDSLKNLKSLDIVDEVLNFLLESFESCVSALCLKCTCQQHVNHVCRSHCDSRSHSPLKSDAITSPDIGKVSEISLDPEEEITGGLFDDVSWFFSDDVAQDFPTSSDPQSDSSPSACQPLSSQEGLSSMSRIWNGLSHCLKSDFDSLYNSNDERLAVLPMMIAQTTVSHLVGCNITSIENVRSLISPLRSPLLKKISFVCIQGQSISKTDVYLDTVVEFCENKMLKNDNGAIKSPHVAAHGTRVYSSYQQALAFHSARAGCMLSGLGRVGIVSLAVCTDDNSTSQLRNSGNGGSGEADTLQHRISRIHHATTIEAATNTIHQLNNGDVNYIDKALAHLIELKVQVLICPYAAPMKLLDACYENGICVIPMSTDNLFIMSKLVRADVMEDILDLYPECLGCIENAKNEGGEGRMVRITAKDCVKQVQVDEMDAVYRNLPSVMLLVQVVGNEPSADHPIIPLLSMPYANSCPTNHKECYRHVSVVITCPTAVLGSVVEDRIRKNISRIDMTLHNPLPPMIILPFHCSTCKEDISCLPRCDCLKRRLVPGGGIVEALCAVHITHLKNTPALKNVSMYSDRLVHALQDFSCTASVNNGATTCLALTKWTDCVHKLIQLCVQQDESKSDHTGRTSTLDMSNLTTCDLMMFPRPISVNELHDDEEMVLDVAGLKVEAMRVACFAVKSILNTSFVVTLA